MAEKKKDEETKASSGDSSSKPQGKTNATRDKDAGTEAVIRDDAELSSAVRLVPDAGEDVGEGEIQARKDAEDERGFRGTASDPTPNEHYTVAGVTKGLPTPETNFEQRRAARDGRILNEGVEPL